MADTYEYAKQNIQRNSSTSNGALPNDLKADKVIPDSIMNSVGLYSKKDIDEAKFSKFSRFGRVIDPYGRLNDCREYLFFVKPDLHIVVPDNNVNDNIYKLGLKRSNGNYYQNNGLTLNPQLDGNTYFKDLINGHPDVIKELQYSAPGNNGDPFGHLLSFTTNSYLELPGSEASTLDNPSTVFGTSYEYLKDAEEADENPSFSLEFLDNKYLDTYHFFKAYTEYHIARKSGFVTPPNLDYYRYKRLHNTMGIYKFLVAEDMETIIYWAYFWGVYPISCPRETFGDPLFSEGLSFSVNFKAAFMEDMNPTILYQFNQLMSKTMAAKGINKDNWMPVLRQNMSNVNINIGSSNIQNRSYDPTLNPPASKVSFGNTTYEMGPSDMIDGTLPRAAWVDSRQLNGVNDRFKYRLRWYA